jgi:hypothetical protein
MVERSENDFNISSLARAQNYSRWMDREGNQERDDSIQSKLLKFQSKVSSCC